MSCLAMKHDMITVRLHSFVSLIVRNQRCAGPGQIRADRPGPRQFGPARDRPSPKCRARSVSGFCILGLGRSRAYICSGSGLARPGPSLARKICRNMNIADRNCCSMTESLNYRNASIVRLQSRNQLNQLSKSHYNLTSKIKCSIHRSILNIFPYYAAILAVP